jgi:hypothetical protein
LENLCGRIMNIFLSSLSFWRCVLVDCDRKRVAVFALITIILGILPTKLLADVPQGSPLGATNYYKFLSQKLNFSTPDLIFQTKLDDVTAYFGYAGLTGRDLQNNPPGILMSANLLLELAKSPVGAQLFEKSDGIVSNIGANPFDTGDVLVTRFFAPKIMNISLPEETRPLGWRKLVRLHARPGSMAQANHIRSGIILFNFFTKPGEQPFPGTNQSVNTQVILVPEAAHFSKPNDITDLTTTNYDMIYWLDYDTLANGGKLSLALNASFDANELQLTNNGVRPYFVPEGCIACHGNNKRAPLVNYLDTDHWFDRIENDFTAFKTNGLPLLVDAGNNDTNSRAFKMAFDVIKTFNVEADEQVNAAQPKHDESRASRKWLEIHDANNNYSHVPPLDRAIGIEPWSAANTNDEVTLSALNQYCFRCHGTVKFSVFNRQEICDPKLLPIIAQAIKPDAIIGVRMPTDRPLPENVRQLINDFINQNQGK